MGLQRWGGDFVDSDVANPAANDLLHESPGRVMVCSRAAAERE